MKEWIELVRNTMTDLVVKPEEITEENNDEIYRRYLIETWTLMSF